MKISIAMCTYNGAHYLSEQLASIVAQTRQPDELIVCDDASVDETLTVLQDSTRNAPFQVSVVENPRRLGSTKNFEHAIELCRGDVIFLCDQDDIWVEKKLAEMEQEFIQEPDVDLLFTDADLIDEKGQPLGRTMWQALRFDEASKRKIRSDSAYELLDRREVVTGATMAFRSKFKDLVLPIPENIPLIHDGWIATMISHAGKLEFIEEPLIRYRQHGSQQLGAPQTVRDSRSRITRLNELAQRAMDFGQELKKAESLQQRMYATRDRYQFVGKQNVDQLLLHFRTRESIAKAKLANAPAIIRELVAGRYHRYSRGFSSAVKDILR
ncbi:MAG TPA: glycosyltransferase family 2 protein [Pyrinomonadaceae bacterium]